jgi:hypothetical protein
MGEGVEGDEEGGEGREEETSGSSFASDGRLVVMDSFMVAVRGMDGWMKALKVTG